MPEKTNDAGEEERRLDESIAERRHDPVEIDVNRVLHQREGKHGVDAPLEKLEESEATVEACAGGHGLHEVEDDERSEGVR